MEDAVGEISLLLAGIRSGDSGAIDRLASIVYAELRRLAAHHMRAERINHTLQPTALVHEAFLRLIGQDRSVLQNRGQFLGVAAQAMRRILVDHARRRVRERRGGPLVQLVSDSRVGEAEGAGAAEEVLAVHLAVERLATVDRQQAQVVELRYFGGLSVEETAEALDISPRTVKREWAMARAWLRTQFGSDA